MTDLSARLRDVLTPELRERSDFHRPQDWQDVMVSALLPLLSSLLEEREREIREALAALVERLDYVHDSPAYESVWACSQLHQGPYYGPQYTNKLKHARDVLSRLASSSSPAAPQEQEAERVSRKVKR